MSGFSIDRAALDQLLHGPDGPVARDLERRAIRVESAAKRLVRQHGTGRIYHLTNPTRTHQASAPGQPPATDLGRLGASITHELGADNEGLVARVGTNVEYALFLEVGTRHMAPRPFLRPALVEGADR